MRRIIAAGAAVLLLVGCAQKDPFEDLADGNCNSSVAESVNQHISGQIDALADKDWELAYSFASDNFQSGVSIENFTLIIGTQYPMLIENEGYQFNECSVTGNTIKQDVNVLSGDQEFGLTYTLTVIDSVLGVESAVVGEISSQI